MARVDADGFIKKVAYVDLMDIDDESYARCNEALGAADYRDRVRDLAMPLTVIAGEVDPVLTLVDAEATAAAARTGSFHVIAGASHLAPVEKPAEVAAILLSEVPL